MKKTIEKVALCFLSLTLLCSMFLIGNFAEIKANATTSNNWCWPTSVHSIKSDWPNYSSGSYHAGTDFPVALNSPVYSTCDGEVVDIKSLTTSYGKHIKIKAVVNGSTVYMRYCHLNSFCVSVGDKVSAGQLIAYSGSTGNSTGPHMHYEVRDSNDRYGCSSNPNLNPRNYLPGTSYTFETNSSPILPTTIDNRNYAIPATVYASHKIYTYNEYGNQESNRWIDQGDKCYIDAIYVNDYVHVQYPTSGSSEPNRWTYAKLSDFTDVLPQPIPKPSGYNIRVSSTSIYDCESLTVTVTPFEDNFTNIRFYLVKPDGSVIFKDYGTTKSVSLALNKTGVWKIYARVDNAYGSFEGSTSNGCMSVTVSRPNMGSKVDLGSDFYAYIVNKDSGNALTNDNDNVSSKTLQSTTNQRWHFKKQSDGSYQIESVSGNGKCLDAYSGKGRSGDNVQVYKQNNEPVQQWWIYSAGSSVYYLMPTCSGSAVLDVYDASKTSGANVQIWAYNQTAAQKFEIRKIGAADISFSTSSVSLNLCGTNTSTVNITASGNLPSSYHYSANRNTSAMETTWGGWSGSTAPITIKGKKTGTYDLKISLVDGNTDQTLTTKTITVNISCSHNYDSWTTTKSPTCTADGTQQRKCSVCGNTETQTLKALGHSYTTSTVKPTCTSQGYTVHTCSRCSNSYTDNYTSAAGHSYGSWTTTKSPTCTADGTKQRKCSACGNTETQTIKAAGHSYAISVIKPTCTEQGYTLYVCLRCGSSYTENYTSATGHSFGSWTTTKQPTCTADGTKQRKCSDCGKTETQTIKAAGHSYTTSIIQPTYTEQGYTLHTCSKCGHSYKDNYTNVLTNPLVNQSTISKNNTSVGGSIVVTAKASGGSGGYKYAVSYKKSSDSSWSEVSGYSSANSVTVKIPSAGTYTIRVNAKDSKGTMKNKDFTVTVNAALANTSKVSATSITKGKTVTVTCASTGGTGTKKYAVWYKLSSASSWAKVQDYSTTTTAKVTPSATGKYTVRVAVKDGEETIKNKDFAVNVNAALANTSKVSATSITKGKTVTVTCASTGGTGTKKYAVWYKLSSASSWTKVQDYSTTTTAKVTPSATGKYTVRVAVKDGEGTIKNKDFTVTVTAALTNTSKISSAGIKLGGTVKVTCSASGSSGFYQYAVLYKTSSSNKWTTKQNYSSNTSVTIKPASKGTYSVCVKVKDNLGNTSNKYFTVTVK